MSYTYNEKQMDAIYALLEDVTVSKEVKFSLLLDIVDSGNVSLTKAKEICTEQGIFHKHWIAVEEKATELFTKKYNENEIPVTTQLNGNTNEEIIVKKRFVQNGNLALNNVPFIQRGKLGPDGESEYLSSQTLYKMTEIFEYMLMNRISEFDFNDYETIK